MKLVIAYIQPEKLNDVKKTLFDKDIKKMSVTNYLGCGQQSGYTESYRGTMLEVNLHKKLRIEVAVNDDFADVCIEAIVSGARTGAIGDGKIFVVPIEECVRIRTGEKGSEAIG